MVSDNHEVLDTYVARVRTQIIDFFKRAHTNTSADNMIRTRLRHEANPIATRSQAKYDVKPTKFSRYFRLVVSQVAMRSSTKLFSPTPSTTILDDGIGCLNEFKSACVPLHRVVIRCVLRVLLILSLRRSHKER